MIFANPVRNETRQFYSRCITAKFLTGQTKTRRKAGFGFTDYPTARLGKSDEEFRD